MATEDELNSIFRGSWSWDRTGVRTFNLTMIRFVFRISGNFPELFFLYEMKVRQEKLFRQPPPILPHTFISLSLRENIESAEQRQENGESEHRILDGQEGEGIEWGTPFIEGVICR